MHNVKIPYVERGLEGLGEATSPELFQKDHEIDFSMHETAAYNFGNVPARASSIAGGLPLLEFSTGTEAAALFLSISSILSLETKSGKYQDTGTQNRTHLRLIFTGCAVTLAFFG
jgi:hypothetical protein